MPLAHGRIPQPHDLLELEVERFIHSSTSVPEWVEATLRMTPFAVCRRSPPIEGRIAIGVRGAGRDQRWPGTCAPDLLVRMISPHDLSRLVPDPLRASQIPAMQVFALLQERWKDCGLLWGPGGSVGFELATGTITATRESDLDIVVQAPHRISKEQAASLCNQSDGLACAVDIRVETTVSSFSLREYATTSRILIRVPRGSLLGCDPWDLQLVETAS